MDHSYFENISVRAATIDEILSDDYEPLTGQKNDADLAAKRLSSWCKVSASGDWSIFSDRLKRDNLSFDVVLARFARVRRNPSAPPVAWLQDGIWIYKRLQYPTIEPESIKNQLVHCDIQKFKNSTHVPFADLLYPVVVEATAKLWSKKNKDERDRFSLETRESISENLLIKLSELCSPLLYEWFFNFKKGNKSPQTNNSRWHYDNFITYMLKEEGFRKLFDENPVLLRLISTLVKNWIDTNSLFIARLTTDITSIESNIFKSTNYCRVEKLEFDLSDPHNGGRSVIIITFDNGSRLVYKPKDVRVDASFSRLVNYLNRFEPPIDLKNVKILCRNGYGWAQYITHEGCRNSEEMPLFFKRAGAYLALMHLLSGGDIHQENIIAHGDHPLLIDLEMLFQTATFDKKTNESATSAYVNAAKIIDESVAMVGLLPAYGKLANNDIYDMGGLTPQKNHRDQLVWLETNTDGMRPERIACDSTISTNLPHFKGNYAKFEDYKNEFIEGFKDYSKFMSKLSFESLNNILERDFYGIPVRKVIRPTKFYTMLLHRLKNPKYMSDGILWSTQSDFICRLSNWEKKREKNWPLLKAERKALLQLDVPYFIVHSNQNEVYDINGITAALTSETGIVRVKNRLKKLGPKEISWQVKVIEQNTSTMASSSSLADKISYSDLVERINYTKIDDNFLIEANNIAQLLYRHAIRRKESAAWIGLDWLGDSNNAQLIALGPNLYNGNAGISIFLSAHAAFTGSTDSKDLAIAGLSLLRKNIKHKNRAQLVRSIGLGGAIGIGSIIYALTLISNYLHDDNLIDDALLYASMITDENINDDKQLDVIGGCAGLILCLIRLYSMCHSQFILETAVKCGEHLLRQPRQGKEGSRSWIVKETRNKPLNGMSHGASGFAYAMSSLANTTNNHKFMDAALECLKYEDNNFDCYQKNWPDFRISDKINWPNQWCHGATGIGLARIAMLKLDTLNLHPQCLNDALKSLRDAIDGTEMAGGSDLDTLCCGKLGNVELLDEAGRFLDRPDLCQKAKQILINIISSSEISGDYRWNAGSKEFNPGFFRGMSGLGYTLLRRADSQKFKNVLYWE